MSKRIYLKAPSGINTMSDEQLEEVAKQIQGKVIESFSDDNWVKVFGSSIEGQAFGQDNFNIAHLVLSQLQRKGRIKCRDSWCRLCTLYRLSLADGVVGHVVKLSFPNVIELSKKIDFAWTWQNPESEWAKEHGEARDVFKRLVEVKSRPVWYAVIQSEENIMKLLGAPPRKPLEISTVEVYHLVLRKSGVFEDSGLSEDYRSLWNHLVYEISNRPAGSAPWPINEWVGDE